MAFPLKSLHFKSVCQIGQEAVFEIDLILIRKWSGPFDKADDLETGGIEELGVKCTWLNSIHF
jgi:hypothetical protein